VDIFPRGTQGDGNSNNQIGSGSDIALVVKVPTTQSVDSIDLQQSNGTVLWSVNSAGQGGYLGGVAGAGQFCTQVTLTAANIIAMYTTPVSILAAPAAGSVILVDMIHLQTLPTATQFTSGGVVTLVYHGGSVNPHSSSIAASVILSATGSNNLLPPITTAIQPPSATGIDITNATGVFATGTGTAVVTIWYSIFVG